MIHEIGVELQAALRPKGCPFPVLDRESTATATNRNAIVLEHDRDASDTFGPVVSQSINPKQRAIRYVAAKLTIYAQSTRDGAKLFEHERVAASVIDQVYVGLEKVIRARKQRFTIKDARFVTPPDLEGTERFGGVMYVMKLAIARGVNDVTFAGDALPEFTVPADGMTSTTKVSYANGQIQDEPPPDAETACGG